MLLFVLEVHKKDSPCSARDNKALVFSLVDNLLNPPNTQKVSKKDKLKQKY